MELNYLWATIFIPVVIGFFKKEISTFIGDLMIYRNRAFDADGDPGTSQATANTIFYWSEVDAEI